MRAGNAKCYPLAWEDAAMTSEKEQVHLQSRIAERSMKTRRSVHQTQWAAQFAVASELCKRAYQVALTLGNHPTVDLMVISPCGEQFVIDVKGQYRKAFWPVTRKPPNLRVFYVLAFVPDNAPNRFALRPG
jgi:hypothetical protein